LLEKLLDVTPIPYSLEHGSHLEEHIHLLEMRAVLLSLRHFQEVIQRQSLLIATDNTTVAAAFAILDGLKAHDKISVRTIQSLNN
jgi:carbamoyl-phosphate synthase large subunit